MLQAKTLIQKKIYLVAIYLSSKNDFGEF